MRRLCPVCRQTVEKPVRYWNCITGHWDSIGRDLCPASWEPYEITLIPEKLGK